MNQNRLIYTKDGVYTYWLATHLPTYQNPQPPAGDVTLKQAVLKVDTAPKLFRYFEYVEESTHKFVEDVAKKRKP